MLGILNRLKEKRFMGRDPVGYARSLGVRVGNDCRLLGMDAWTFGSEPYLVTLGNHVTVTGGVRFVTHDGGVWVFRDRAPNIDIIAPIRVGNNVFLGLNVVVLPGVSIGDNVVVGVGSVVTRDIPSNTVAVGTPARVVRTLDDYWGKVEAAAMHIRDMDPEAKRRHLLERFGLD